MEHEDARTGKEWQRPSMKDARGKAAETLEHLSPEKLLQLIRQLQQQNLQLQRAHTEMTDLLRSKDAMLENLTAQLAEVRQSRCEDSASDQLTGLLTRRAALKFLSKELARCKRNGDELAIGLCEIDNFRALNDIWGPPVANEVLCWFARTLSTSIREYDTVARLGEETFLLIMPLKPGMEADTVCERLCGQIANSLVATRGGEIGVTTSIGVAYAAKTSIVKDLWAEADAALRQAKKQGGNRTVYFLKA